MPSELAPAAGGGAGTESRWAPSDSECLPTLPLPLPVHPPPSLVPRALHSPDNLMAFSALRSVGLAGAGRGERLRPAAFARAIGDGKTEVVRFQMSSEPRCAACLVTVRHGYALLFVIAGSLRIDLFRPAG